MRYVWISLLLAGCIPIKHELPRPPAQITERCPELIQVTQDEERLSEFLKVVSKNYTLYYDCASKHDLFVQWYNDQKAVHDGVFNK